MVWGHIWSYKVDGHELNDLVKYVTQIPEIQNVPEQEAILVDMAGDYPEFIRMQPTHGVYTIEIQMQQPCDWSAWDSRLAELKAWLAPGEHTLAVQVRGMPNVQTVTIVTRGLLAEAKLRRAVVQAIAPTPVLV